MYARVARRLSEMPYRLVARATALPAIDGFRNRRYRAALERHHDHLPPADDAQAVAFDALSQHGVATTDFDALAIPGASAVIAQATALVADNLDYFRRSAASGRDFLLLPTADLMRRPAIYRLGLDPRLLDFVERYLGLPVAYDGVTIQYTVADGREVATRCWHRDREDRRMVKVAVYLNDVDGDGGPFELLPIPEPAGPKRVDRFLLEHDDVIALADDAGIAAPISCEGPAGTVVLADTGRFFHRGKPATGRDRAAIFFSYFSSQPQRPFYCDRSGLTRTDVRSLVDGLSDRQRRAALWHDRLPRRWRYIRPAAV